MVKQLSIRVKSYEKERDEALERYREHKFASKFLTTFPSIAGLNVKILNDVVAYEIEVHKQMK